MKNPLLTIDYRLPRKQIEKLFGHLLNENLITIRLFLLIFGDIDENFITQFYDPSKCRSDFIRPKKRIKQIYWNWITYLSDVHSPLCSQFHIHSSQSKFQMKTHIVHCLRPSPIIYKSHIKLTFYYVLLLRLYQTHSILSIFQSNSFISVSFDCWICEPHFSLQRSSK